MEISLRESQVITSLQIDEGNTLTNAALLFLKDILNCNKEIQKIIRENISPDSVRDHLRRTPLHRAVKVGSLSGIKTLISIGADVNAGKFV